VQLLCCICGEDVNTFDPIFSDVLVIGLFRNCVKQSNQFWVRISVVRS